MKKIRKDGVAAKRSAPKRDARLGGIKRSMMIQVAVVGATWSRIELVTHTTRIRQLKELM